MKNAERALGLNLGFFFGALDQDAVQDLEGELTFEMFSELLRAATA